MQIIVFHATSFLFPYGYVFFSFHLLFHLNAALFKLSLYHHNHPFFKKNKKKQGKYIWHSLLFICYLFSIQVHAASFQSKLLMFIWKYLWRRMLETNRKQIPHATFSNLENLSEIYWPKRQSTRHILKVALDLDLICQNYRW